MAIRYLWDSSSTPTSPYTGGWDNAAQTYAAVAAVWSVGDVIYMAKDHQETGAPLTLSGASGDSGNQRVRIFSMERTGTTYDPQTSSYNFQSTGSGNDLAIQDYVDFYGVYFETENGDQTNYGTSRYRDCTFSITGATTSRKFFDSSYYCYVDSCTFNGGAGSADVNLNANSNGNRFIDCTYTGKMARNTFGPATSVVGGKFDPTTPPSLGFAIITGDVLHTEYSGADDYPQIVSVPTTQPFTQSVAFATDAAGASYGRGYHTQSAGEGYCTPTTAMYRDGGWVDSPSSTALSWKMTMGALGGKARCNLFSPLVSSRLDTTGSKTFTAYGLHDYTSAPDINEVIMNVFYLGTSNSQRWHLASTEGDPDATTSLTSDTSTWTGRTTETRFKLSKTVTVNNVGEWGVCFWLRKYSAGEFVWICPKVEIT